MNIFYIKKKMSHHNKTEWLIHSLNLSFYLMG